MSNIGSIPSFTQPPAAVKANYETNVKAYGPVVAGVEGVADAVVDAGSAVVSFSAEGLEKLGDVAQSGLQSVSDALDDVASSVSGAIDSAEQSVVGLYNEVADMAHHGVDKVEDAASSVVDGLKSAAQTAAKYVGLGVEATKQSV